MRIKKLISILTQQYRDVPMDDSLIVYPGQPSALAVAAQVADQFAQANILADYRRGKEPKTLDRQRTDLALFEAFLAEAGAPTSGLADDLALWQDISPGLVKAFLNWQLAKGYRIGSCNVRLSTVRTYAGLAAQAGYLPGDRAQLIELVHGISHKQGRNIDATREQASVGAKKHEPIRISPAHVALLKQQLLAEAMQGDTLASRDLLLFLLPSEHSLRCSELALLKRENLDLEAGLLRIYRQKSDRWQLHQLTPSALVAAQHYLRSARSRPGSFLARCQGQGWQLGRSMTGSPFSANV